MRGTAAMLLGFDIVEAARAEHDEWHTHEHLPERLSIPGFLRGSRWFAVRGAPAYLVMYEVEALGTLESGAYHERLDHPTPWTTRMMAHYRGMRRGLCSVTSSHGSGLGGFAHVVRATPGTGKEVALRAWLGDVLKGVASSRGGVSSHLFESAAAPRMTNEQRIRGADASVDWVVVVTGYDVEALDRIATDSFHEDRLVERGMLAVSRATYAMQHVLTAADVVR